MIRLNGRPPVDDEDDFEDDEEGALMAKAGRKHCRGAPLWRT